LIYRCEVSSQKCWWFQPNMHESFKPETATKLGVELVGILPFIKNDAVQLWNPSTFVTKLYSLPKHRTDVCNWSNHKGTFSGNDKWTNAAICAFYKTNMRVVKFENDRVFQSTDAISRPTISMTFGSSHVVDHVIWLRLTIWHKQ